MHRFHNDLRSQGIYPVDPGLARVFAARVERGHLLETAVYLELRRRGGEARERELRALDEAMAEHGLDRGTEVRTSSGWVRMVPAWRWLLER